MFKIYKFVILIICLSLNGECGIFDMNSYYNTNIFMNMFNTMITNIQNQMLAQIPYLNATNFNCSNSGYNVNCAGCNSVQAPLLMLNLNCIYIYIFKLMNNI
jgi:hypothetical protein